MVCSSSWIDSWMKITTLSTVDPWRRQALIRTPTAASTSLALPEELGLVLNQVSRVRQFRRGVARVHVVLGWQQAPPGQVGVDWPGHLAVGHGRVRGLHVCDQVRWRDGLTVTVAAAAVVAGNGAGVLALL
jgi:hypothetical protein